MFLAVFVKFVARISSMYTRRRHRELREADRGSALAPWKAKCIQGAYFNTNCKETAFYKNTKDPNNHMDFLLFVRVYLWVEYLCTSFICMSFPLIMSLFSNNLLLSIIESFIIKINDIKVWERVGEATWRK